MSAVGSCYHVGNVSMTFIEAKRYCREHGSNLIHIDSAQENNYLKNYALRHTYEMLWIGLTDLMAESHYMWIDDNTEAQFTDWAQGQPNGGYEDCILLYNKDSYRWHDYPCEGRWYPVCETIPSHVALVG
ncbi:perlucin-like protein [Dreissena polymorpha]|uniref:perlucin-like protein n=1 Tax=Dreissena polymorpha TaxID=45954 RepID=UPI0022646958|nr:perlucin-like protein [Dreissena polymorpha]